MCRFDWAHYGRAGLGSTVSFCASMNAWRPPTHRQSVNVDDMRHHCAVHAVWMSNHPDVLSFSEHWAERCRTSEIEMGRRVGRLTRFSSILM